MTSRLDFLATVRGYLNTPYKHQARLPGVGMDCPAPLICAAVHHGIKPAGFDVTAYPRDPDGHTLQALCDEHLTRIVFSEVKPADVLLCRFREGRPQHLGIVSTLNPLRWIHAASGSKVRESQVAFGPMRMALVQAYRVPGLV
jgi:cell wall-associated NlpC family hydrolase